MAKKSRLQQDTERIERGVKERTREQVRQHKATLKVSDEALVDAFKGFENIDVAERRLLDPNLPGTLPLRLKDEPSHAQDPHNRRRKWYLRWFNAGMPSRLHNARQVLGYAPVLWKELQDETEIAGAFKGSEDVRKGDGGKEVLMKMPMSLYLKIKAKQSEKHARKMTGKALKEEAIAAAHQRGLMPDDDNLIGPVGGTIRTSRDTLVSPEDGAGADLIE